MQTTKHGIPLLDFFRPRGSKKKNRPLIGVVVLLPMEERCYQIGEAIYEGDRRVGEVTGIKVEDRGKPHGIKDVEIWTQVGGKAFLYKMYSGLPYKLFYDQKGDPKK
jgi:hypothetical protein